MSQDQAVSVYSTLPAYTAAVAELPVSAAHTENVRGAVAVVPGAGDWWQGMLAARAGGASAVVLADPAVLPRGAGESERWPGDIPVIVERPRVRFDVVAAAVAARRGSPARIITVECAAPAAGLGALICDGFGWMRSLAGGALALQSSIATVHSRIALLDSVDFKSGTVPATLSATTIGGLPSGGLLQVLVLGEVRTEVTVDQPAGFARVETATEEGSLRAPVRYESSARVALRRAFDACLSGEPATDLEELLQDLALTRALLDA
ncbi:MAG: hypothetical protein JWQ56_3693 [Pseudarthrobacter sp.]|nr:hypothetical protein [Pseudarthrobacter sp.]